LRCFAVVVPGAALPLPEGDRLVVDEGEVGAADKPAVDEIARGINDGVGCGGELLEIDEAIGDEAGRVVAVVPEERVGGGLDGVGSGAAELGIDVLVVGEVPVVDGIGAGLVAPGKEGEGEACGDRGAGLDEYD
jgi:hypothetical protein